jgi:hypothetical protein
MLAISIPIQYNFGIPGHSNKTRVINKRDSNRKEELKLFLFT